MKPLLSLQGWRGRLLDIAVGAIAILGHAPFHYWPVTLICFGLLMARLDAARELRNCGFRTAFTFAFGYFLAGTFWIGSAFIERGPEFIPVMPPMILGLAALLALFWGIAGRVYVRRMGRGWYRWVALVCLLWVAEFTRGHIFGGFPWNLPGYIFEAGSLWSQSAHIYGIYGLSFVTFVLALGLATLLMRTNRGFGVTLFGIMMGWLVVTGLLRQATMPSPGEQRHDNVTIRIVQVPFSQKDKFDRDKSVAIVNDFIRTSLEPGIENVTHLVWPEGAVVGLALENEPLIYAMGKALSEGDETPPYWLLNSLREERFPPGPGKPPKSYYYNTSAVIAFDKEGRPKLAAFNDKAKLVPFGEFIPGGEIMERLGSATLSTSLASITPAPTKELSVFPGLPLGSPQICYEIIFSGLTPLGDSAKAEWILNQSNDAWFGKSLGPAQHANIAAYRAIEEGVPIIRSASNGVSGLIDPYGNYVHKLGPQDKGVIDFHLPKSLTGTPYTRWMDWALLLLNLLLIGMSIFVNHRDTQRVEV